MSTLTLRHPQPSWVNSVLEALANTVAGIIEGHEISARYRALSRLSDIELARLGLTREQVPHAAVQGVGLD
jgi:uncharacterized protein YjiS (DUF1127 family)